MTQRQDKIRLMQEQNLEKIFKKTLMNEMVTVYYSDSSEGHHNHGIYCALIPNSEVKKCLVNTAWDLSHDDGKPRAIVHYENGVDVPTYYRYGSDRGIEPLIFDREFHGIRPSYKEINEEFRLFHNLFHDTKENKYIKIDDNGVEEVVAVLREHEIQIRLKEIRQFLAIKEMHLAIQFYYREYSQQPLEQLGLSLADNKVVHNESECWALGFGDIRCANVNGYSRLLGKKMIAPLPKSQSGMWGFAQEESDQYADFIIAVNDDGDNITYSANPEAPNYFTPVHFRKEVLDKYYRKPSKFSVEDNYLRCGSLWGLQIDNHHLDKVCVWLGDLGCTLPYEEQLHWKSHNIAPEGTISDVYYKRQILGEFTDSNQLDHIFKGRYNALNDACTKILTWQLLLPFRPEDSHHLSSIRIPATEEQSEFDELILSLAKILVDSLNEKQLNKLIPDKDRPNIKGSISRLEKVFQLLNINSYEEHIDFLRKLQNLRSTGVAHRKGSDYQKIADEFGVTSGSLVAVFGEILRRANDLLEFLTKVVQDGLLNSQE
ncbi:MAG: hypothetical protein GX218_05535 [Clostridiaceae bacterium]|nr:hypothetical protein [Clostridiaceae bacterium]